MAETVKKTKAAAKPRKAPVKKAAILTMKAPGTPKSVSHEDVAQLAHRFWAERGFQHGHDAEDWFRAEQELRGKAS